MLKTTNETRNGAQITGADCWVEGCRLHAPLTLHGRSVVVGVDVGEPFEMPEGACLDVTPGFNRQDEPVWFVRYYGVEDTFKHSLAGEATFCGRRFADWLTQVGADGTRVWDAGTPEGERTLWNARVFPAERVHGDYRQWRWMCDVELQVNSIIFAPQQFFNALSVVVQPPVDLIV